MLFSLVAVSAAPGNFDDTKTIIAGKIYNSDYTATIAGANVTVTCEDSDFYGVNVENTVSLSDGAYSVVFYQEYCNYGDTLTVSATYGDLYGSQSGVIHDNALPGDWDLAVVNVPLVPEFGLIAGLTTILGALGIFFFVRKK